MMLNSKVDKSKIDTFEIINFKIFKIWHRHQK